MQITRSRTLTAALGVALGALVLTGCTAEPAPAPADPEVEVIEDGTPAEAETPAAPSDGTPAEWANPYQVIGDHITTIAVGEIAVDVYQVAVTEATKTGSFADPSTNKPIIDVGDEIVFAQYVVTNNGAPIDLGSSMVAVSARYADWPYLQGMDAISDSALYELLGLSSTALAPGAFRTPSIYTLGTGESYAIAENFAYQPGSLIEFDVRAIPVDASGSLQHDLKVEAKGSGTIQ